MSVSASEVVIRDAADKFKLPCQRVHAVTVTVCRRPDSSRRWLTPASKNIARGGDLRGDRGERSLPQI